LLVEQKEVYERSLVKRPCNAFTLFIKDFMKRKANDFVNVKEALVAGKELALV